MLRGIYNVASAMEAAARNQEIVAENLTHAVTPGYRRQGSLFEVNSPHSDNTQTATPNSSSGANTRGFSNFESGPLQQTDNPFDLALVGNGFFVVEGPDGRPLYTRNGSFERNASGELQTRGGGLRVRGNSGNAIRIPAEVAGISFSTEGAVLANGAEIGRLELATFDRPEAMRRVGTTLFDADNPQTPPPGALRIEQGFREGSNVQPVQEMVAMMVGMRYYEASERVMRAISDAIAQNTRVQQ